MLNLAFFLLIFVLPLIVLPFGTSYFETPKIIIGELLIEVIFIYVFIKFSSKLFLKYNFSFKIILLILAILSLLSLILFQNKEAFFGNIFRMQGVFMFLNLLLLSLISSTFKFKNISNSIFIALLISLLVSTFIFNTSLEGRAIGTAGEPNALATTALFIFAFSIYNTKKYLKVVSFLLTFIIIIFTGSRTGALGFILVNLFWLLNSLFKLSLNKSFLIVASLFLTILFIPFFYQFDLSSIAASHRFQYEDRVDIWKTAFYSGLSSPLVGHGFGSISQELKTTSFKLNNNIHFSFVDSTHNIFLDFWIQTGFLGLFFFTLLLYLSFKNAILSKNFPIILSLLALIISLSFNPASSVHLFALFWVIGQSFAKA